MDKLIEATAELAINCNQIIKEIMEYESDTFSSSSSEITKAEATLIVAKVIKDRLWVGNNLDGVEIDSLLFDMRDIEDPEESVEQCASNMLCVSCGLELDAPKAEVLDAGCECECHTLI